MEIGIWVRRLVLIVGGTFSTAVIGGLLGGRVFTPPGAMGFDAIANALGGLMVGGLLGLVASVAAAFLLKGARLHTAAWIAGGFGVLVLVILVVSVMLRGG